MNRQWVKTLLALWALTLAVVWLRRAFVTRPSDELPLSIRIAGLTTNMSPSGFEWNVAVPKPKGQGDAVLFWSVRFEETNKPSVHNSNIALSPTERDLMSIPYAADESGILTWSYGASLKPETVYRVIGCYNERKSLSCKLRSWCQRFPAVSRMLPESKLRFATSEWFEVTTTMNPSGERQ